MIFFTKLLTNTDSAVSASWRLECRFRGVTLSFPTSIIQLAEYLKYLPVFSYQRIVIDELVAHS